MSTNFLKTLLILIGAGVLIDFGFFVTGIIAIASIGSWWFFEYLKAPEGEE